jgi:hypothetical protein
VTDGAGAAASLPGIAVRRRREQLRLTAAMTAAAADRLAERECVIAGLRRCLWLTQRRLAEAELRLALAEPVTDPDRLAVWDASAAPTDSHWCHDLFRRSEERRKLGLENPGRETPCEQR